MTALKECCSQNSLTEYQKSSYNKLVEKGEEQVSNMRQLVQDFKMRFHKLRDDAIERFTPLLLQTVEKYDATFNTLPELLDQSGVGEIILQRIAVLCRSITCKTSCLQQPLPSAHRANDIKTLMILLQLAMQAAPILQTLAKDAVRHAGNHCAVLAGPKPTKGIRRALAKALEEYEGDFTRILDLSRVTIVVDTLKEVESIVCWLLDKKRPSSSRFDCCRIKDRLSRRWDSETSGGNRDILVNGWLDLGGGRMLITEIQIHLRALFCLKSDLHVLYVGVRVLGAMEGATMCHKGVVTDDTLAAVERGVIRQIHSAHMGMKKERMNRLAKILQTEPCALLELQLSSSCCETLDGLKCPSQGCAENMTLGQLLLPSDSPGAIACRRMRKLQLSVCGLVGPIPSELVQCRHLKVLNMSYNRLTGPVPSWLNQLPQLHVCCLHFNMLTGHIPLSLTRCMNLKFIGLCDNALSGNFLHNFL